MTSNSDHRYPAGTVKVKGIAHEVQVDGDGKWHAYVNDGNKHVSAESRDALAKAIERETRKAITKVAVPFVQLTTDHEGRPLARRGVATGLHTRSDRVLVRWSDGETGQLNGWDRDYMGELSGEEAAHWTQMQTDYLELSRQLNAFRAEHKISLTPEVRKALTAAVSGGDPGQDKT